MAAFHCLIPRFVHIHLSTITIILNYNTKLDKIKFIASNNGYTNTNIDRMIYKKRKQLTLKTINHHEKYRYQTP